MKRPIAVAYEFVKAIPGELDERTLYVSMHYATVVHRCLCGCGIEVITPLSRTDWKLIYDGESISLDPSIGNWSFPCRSHYWIHQSAIVWADPWSEEEIAAGRALDRVAKGGCYADFEREKRGVGGLVRLGVGKRFWSWLSRLWSA